MAGQNTEDLTGTYGPELVRFVLKQVGNGEAAGQIVAEAFKALKAQKGAVHHPRGFLFRAAHEKAIDYLRTQGRYNHDLQDIATLAVDIARPRQSRMQQTSPASWHAAGAAKDLPINPTRKLSQGQCEPIQLDPSVETYEEAIMALPTLRMTIFLDRKVHRRSLQEIAQKLDGNRASTAREIAIAVSTVYLSLHPDYPAASQERERLLNAFGWRIRNHAPNGAHHAGRPEGMDSWLRADPNNEAVYCQAAAFWDDNLLRQACEGVEKRLHASNRSNDRPDADPKSGFPWGAVLLLIGFAVLGVVVAWLYPELFDDLLSLLSIST